MIKTDFETFCENCEFIQVTSDTNISMDFADNPVLSNTIITCERINSCRRAVERVKSDSYECGYTDAVYHTKGVECSLCVHKNACIHGTRYNCVFEKKEGDKNE